MLRWFFVLLGVCFTASVLLAVVLRLAGEPEPVGYYQVQAGGQTWVSRGEVHGDVGWGRPTVYRFIDAATGKKVWLVNETVVVKEVSPPKK